jgi:RimJ/RimL family protein N-acetyltransferase
VTRPPATEVYRTDRLVVRRWRDSDADRHLDIYSRMDVVKWLGGGPPRVLESVDQSHEAIRRYAERWPGERFGLWAVEVAATGAVAGSVLLAPMALTGEELAKAPEDGGDVEVGWHFHPDSWGNGYATESARGAIDKGFAEGLSEIVAVVLPGNDPSVAVTRRLGMEPTGRTGRWHGLEMDSFRIRRSA